MASAGLGGNYYQAPMVRLGRDDKDKSVDQVSSVAQVGEKKLPEVAEKSISGMFVTTLSPLREEKSRMARFLSENGEAAEKVETVAGKESS